MKYITFSTIIFFFGLSSIAFSSTVPPTKCPSIEAIKTSPSPLFINKTGPNNYFAFQNPQVFNTDEMWSFTMNIYASSMDDAAEKATNALSTITYQYGPEQYAWLWRCIYNTAPGFQAITSTVAK